MHNLQYKKYLFSLLTLFHYLHLKNSLNTANQIPFLFKIFFKICKLKKNAKDYEL